MSQTLAVPHGRIVVTEFAESSNRGLLDVALLSHLLVIFDELIVRGRLVKGQAILDESWRGVTFGCEIILALLNIFTE